MAQRRAPLAPQGGFVTLEYVLAAALSMVVLVVITNLIVFEYGHGVVTAALDQGTREGARAADPRSACQLAAQQMVDDLLGGSQGSMGGGVSITCTQSPTEVDAVAQTHFNAWLPPMPGWSFTAHATARLELAPS